MSPLLATKKENYFLNLIQFLRISEWMHKYQEILLASLIILIFLPSPTQYLDILVIASIYQWFLLCYGYVINSFADRDQDMKVGKHLEFSYFSYRIRLLIISVLIVGVLGIPFIFEDTRVRLLGLINFFFATFYSFKPLRFKERGLSGLIVAILTQRPLLLLFFIFLVPYEKDIAYILISWLFFVGFVNEIGHQLLDFHNDKKSGTVTFATKIGLTNTKRLSQSVFALLCLNITVPIFIFPFYFGVIFFFALISNSYLTFRYYGHVLKNTQP